MNSKYEFVKTNGVQTRAILSALFFLLPFNSFCKTTEDADSLMQYDLDDYVVVGKKMNTYVKSNEVGSVSVDKKLIDIMPQVMGNTDPLRVMQSMPSVSVNSEYDAGFHVEGGETSHSAILIDKVRIYNPSHFLGLFSVFNPGHFSDIALHKNPYVLTSSDIIGSEMNMISLHETKDPISKDTTVDIGGELTIGPMSSQGTFKLNGKRTELIVSARQAYLNLFYKNLLEIDGSHFNYTFGDYNVSLGVRLNDNHKLSLIGYLGRDKAALSVNGVGNDIDVKWKNYMTLAKLESKCGKATISNDIHLSHYDNDLTYKEDNLHAKLPSHINDYGYEFKFNRRKFGLNASVSYYDVQPQKPEILDGREITTEGTERESGVLGTVHAYQTFFLPLDIKLKTHIRGSLYGADATLFPSLDPSVSFQREFAQNSNAPFSMAFSIGQQHQHLFQTGFSNMGLPTEFWLIANEKRKPQRMRGLGLDYEQRFYDGEYKLQISSYYRRLANQIEYSGDLMSLITDEYILDNLLLTGTGENYGVNIMIQRVKGNLVGWISYGYSRSMREFNSDKDTWMTGKYPSSQDRPHQLNAVLTYKKKKWDVGANYVFASGKPYTAPQSIFVMEGKLLNTYGKYNGNRLPSYMRLDLSSNYYFKKTDENTIGLNLSFYNVLMRKNVLMYRLKKTTSETAESDYIYGPLSFFIKMLPSLSFFVKF